MSRSIIRFIRFSTFLFLGLVSAYVLIYGGIPGLILHVLSGMATFYIYIWSNPSPKERRVNPGHDWTIRHTRDLILFGLMGFAVSLIFDMMPQIESQSIAKR
ncbi:MAG: hypothetical protein AAB381_00715 [Patescibacteria group bacterium]